MGTGTGRHRLNVPLGQGLRCGEGTPGDEGREVTGKRSNGGHFVQWLADRTGTETGPGVEKQEEAGMAGVVQVPRGPQREVTAQDHFKN